MIGLSNLALRIQEGLDDPQAILNELDDIRRTVSLFPAETKGDVAPTAGAMPFMTQTAETMSRVPEEERPNLRSQLLDEFARQRRLLKKEKPETVFRKPVESTTHLKQPTDSGRSLTVREWVDSLTEDEHDQLAYDLGCWWETRKLWQRVFIFWVFEPVYGQTDRWTRAECPMLPVTLWERRIQNYHPLEQGQGVRKWLDGISKAKQSNLDKEVSYWWNHLRLDQQAGAHKHCRDKMDA